MSRDSRCNHVIKDRRATTISIEGNMIEMASACARFGMDIGGTLCKVVYFEPVKELASPAADRKQHIRSFVLGDTDNLSIGQSTGCVRENAHSNQTNETVPSETNCPQNTSGNNRHLKEDENVKTGSQGFCVFDSIKTPLDALWEDKAPETCQSTNLRKIWLSSHVPVDLPGRGTLHFKCFETWRMEEFLRLAQEHSLVDGRRVIGATGGGARKFFNKFSDIAGLQLKHSDELKSLVWGIDYLVKNAQHEIFEYPLGSYKAGRIQRPWRSPETSSDEEELSDNPKKVETKHSDGDHMFGNCDKDCTVRENENKEKTCPTVASTSLMLEKDGGIVYLDECQSLYPYLVVNIGSGVSILKVDSPGKFQRVGGTSLGGSTFLGLASALTGCNSFEEAINLATKGDSTQIDMLVGDIYGGDYPEMGLAATTVASSFGKLVDPRKRDVAKESPEHLAKAALLMITNNIGSIAMLHARSTNVRHVLFTGSFLHGNRVAMKLLAIAMEFWSNGQIQAIFLQHEGHAGAVGAMLGGLDQTSREYSFLL